MEHQKNTFEPPNHRHPHFLKAPTLLFENIQI